MLCPCFNHVTVNDLYSIVLFLCEICALHLIIQFLKRTLIVCIRDLDKKFAKKDCGFFGQHYPLSFIETLYTVKQAFLGLGTGISKSIFYGV
jgi:hypothetical protein